MQRESQPSSLRDSALGGIVLSFGHQVRRAALCPRHLHAVLAVVVLTTSCAGSGFRSLPACESALRRSPTSAEAVHARQRILEYLPKADPWRSIAAQLVDLDDIDGATFDPTTNRLVVWGKAEGRLPPLLLDDLVVALTIIGEGQDLGVSIEPRGGMHAAPAEDSSGPLSVRYIPKSIEGTHLGSVLYEVDRRLKNLGFGRDNVTGETIRCDVPEYRTLQDRVGSRGLWDRGAGYFGRMWFRPRPPRIQCTGYSMRIEHVEMELLPESTNPAVAEYTDHFTKNFAAFAEHSMEFAELTRLHKLVALARWLRDGGFPVEELVASYPLLYVKTESTTPSYFIVMGEKGTYEYVQQVGLIGGVDFSPKNSYRTGTWTTSAEPPRYGSYSETVPVPDYAAAVESARPLPSSNSWEVEFDRNTYTAVMIPLTGLTR